VADVELERQADDAERRLRDGTPLDEDERWALVNILWRAGRTPRRGRPKKGGGQLRWSDYGLTRQWVYDARRSASVPEDIFEAWLKDAHSKGRRPSHRSLMIRGGLINVVSADIFEGTPTGELAESLLRDVERCLQYMQFGKGKRRALFHALRWRLRVIAKDADEGDEG
jgi:hypothetical protein